MRLYIDGTEKTGLVNANDWTKADTVDLPWTARVIAVQGTDVGAVAGILASTDDGSILTDSSWKCTNVYYEGWQLVDFDDSCWPSAHVIALHQTSPWTLVEGIKTNAYWRWTPKYTGGDLVVYFIGKDRFPAGVRQNLQFEIGFPKSNVDRSTEETLVSSWTARVIAVQGTDVGAVAGILASTDDGSILTDSSWKCTNVYYEGWQLVDFDDSCWPSAHVIALHQTSPWTLVEGIKTNAYWIWTPKYTGGDLVVYCRKNIAMPRPCGIRGK